MNDSSKNSVVGIAFDGQPLFMLPIALIEESFSTPTNKLLDFVYSQWLTVKNENMHKLSKGELARTDLELARSIKQHGIKKPFFSRIF